MFQFLLGAMKEVDLVGVDFEDLFQFLIGAMKGSYGISS